MIGDRELLIKREAHSTPWLTDTIWGTARRLKRPEFSDESTPIEDDHLSFLDAGVPAVDLIDLGTTPSGGGMAHAGGYARPRQRRDPCKRSATCSRRAARDREEAHEVGMRVRLGVELVEDLFFGQHRRGRFGPREDRVDLRVA